MSGFWKAEPVGPMTPEEVVDFRHAILESCTSERIAAEFQYQLLGWQEEEIKQVLCLRRLVQAGVIGLGE